MSNNSGHQEYRNDYNLGDYLEKPLPSNHDAEKTIIGAIQVDNALIDQAIEFLKPEDFYSLFHKKVFQAMVTLADKGDNINAVLISEEIKKIDSVDSFGGIVAITSLMTGLPHFSNIYDYVKIVKNKSVTRKLIKAAGVIISEALAEEEDAETLLDRAEEMIFSLSDINKISSFQKAGESVSASIEKTKKIAEAGNAITGLSTGLNDFDLKTLGLQRTDLIIIAARPSMGKTALGICLAQNAAIQAGANVAVFSLEMSKEQLSARMICSHAKIDATRYRAGFLTQEEWARVYESEEIIKGINFYIDDEPNITPAMMRSKLRRLIKDLNRGHQAFEEKKELDLIVVDYLQLMTGSNKSESRQQEVTQISRELKALAKTLNVPLVALSQLSRGPENRGQNHRPMLSDLRESGSIEQDADVVAFIYREDYYAQLHGFVTEHENVAEIIFAKQRNGPTGVIKLRFDRKYTLFENLSQHQDVDPMENDF